MSDTHEALLVIDVQKDFCRGGALAVSEGDMVVEPINALMQAYKPLVFVSRDWHLMSNQAHMGPGKWPVHCVQNTVGAEFHEGLKVPSKSVIISKGYGLADDGYSAFEGVDETGKDLTALLQKLGIRKVVVAGLATDYCVKATVESARKLGLEVCVVGDAIKAVRQDTGLEAVETMKKLGASFVTSDTILARKR